MKKLFCIIAVLTFFPLHTSAMNLGIVSDMHADSKSTRKAGKSTVYPSKAVSYFEKAVKAMKTQGVDVIIALGDNTNSGKKKYYKQLKKIENKYGVKVAWVKGNHDSKNFKYLNDKTNYSLDFGDNRIIILDTNFSNATGNGRITPEALEFYKEKSVTDKKVIVAMHHAPYVKNSDCIWNHEYDWVNDAKTVFSGHWHQNKTCSETRIFPALTEHKKLNFSVIEL
jgi:predicted phosphodiesterase